MGKSCFVKIIQHNPKAAVATCVAAGAVMGLAAIPVTKFVKTARVSLAKKQNLSVKYDARWAFVSGATGGIGCAICKMLAGMHINLVITGRNIEVLAKMKEMIEKEYEGIRVIGLPFDLSEPTTMETVIPNISELIEKEDMRIPIVYLNHGTGYAGAFKDLSDDRIDRAIDLMVKSTTELAHFFVKHMMTFTTGEDEPEFSQNHRRGFICFTSSISDVFAGPLSSMYHAPKTYVTALGSSLSNELYLDNIDVLVVAPGGVSGTQFYKRPEMVVVGDKPINDEGSGCVSTDTVAYATAKAAGRTSYLPVGLSAKVEHSMRFAIWPGSSSILRSMCKKMCEQLTAERAELAKEAKDGKHKGDSESEMVVVDPVTVPDVPPTGADHAQ